MANLTSKLFQNFKNFDRDLGLLLTQKLKNLQNKKSSLRVTKTVNESSDVEKNSSARMIFL